MSLKLCGFKRQWKKQNKNNNKENIHVYSYKAKTNVTNLTVFDSCHLR